MALLALIAIAMLACAIIPSSAAVLDAIMIEDSYYNESGQIERQWIYWSPTRHFIVDKEYRKVAVAGNVEMMNPYAEQNITQNAFYPFVNVHASDRENSFWDRYTGRDLIDAALKSNQ